WPRLLVRRPRSWDGLAGDLEVVDELGPGPDGRALPGLRRVLDELVQARIALAVTAGFDPHWHRSCCWAGSMPSPAIPHMIALPNPAPQYANKFLLKRPLTSAPGGSPWPAPPMIVPTYHGSGP